MLSAVELGAFEGKMAYRASSLDEDVVEISLPRFPMTVGEPVILLMLGGCNWEGSGRLFRNQLLFRSRQ